MQAAFQPAHYLSEALTQATPNLLGQERMQLSLEYLCPESRSRIKRRVEITLCYACQEIIKVEASRKSRLHNKLTALGTQAHFRTNTEANLLSQATWYPHSEAVSPFLDSRLHGSSGLYIEYTSSICRGFAHITLTLQIRSGQEVRYRRETSLPSSIS
jgi:hypothetical protein